MASRPSLGQGRRGRAASLGWWPPPSPTSVAPSRAPNAPLQPRWLFSSVSGALIPLPWPPVHLSVLLISRTRPPRPRPCCFAQAPRWVLALPAPSFCLTPGRGGSVGRGTLPCPSLCPSLLSCPLALRLLDFWSPFPPGPCPHVGRSTDKTLLPLAGGKGWVVGSAGGAGGHPGRSGRLTWPLSPLPSPRRRCAAQRRSRDPSKYGLGARLDAWWAGGRWVRGQGLESTLGDTERAVSMGGVHRGNHSPQEGSMLVPGTQTPAKQRPFLTPRCGVQESSF